jgi:sarcosine oxidase, subunit gamma
MSEPVTALQGAAWDGALRLAEAPATGMVTLRADLAGDAVARAVRDAFGLDLPGRLKIVGQGDRAAAWMAPDEALLFCPPGAVPGLVADLAAALGDRPHLVADVSSARAVIDLTGPGWREVLAKGAPIDLAPGAFGPGDFRRTRLGQVAVAFWASDAETAHLVCFRSVAGFVFDWLRTAAVPGSLPGLWR